MILKPLAEASAQGKFLKTYILEIKPKAFSLHYNKTNGINSQFFSQALFSYHIYVIDIILITSSWLIVSIFVKKLSANKINLQDLNYLIKLSCLNLYLASPVIKDLKIECASSLLSSQLKGLS